MPLQCQGCHTASWCSEACERRAAGRHSIECGYLRRLASPGNKSIKREEREHIAILASMLATMGTGSGVNGNRRCGSSEGNTAADGGGGSPRAGDHEQNWWLDEVLSLVEEDWKSPGSQKRKRAMREAAEKVHAWGTAMAKAKAKAAAAETEGSDVGVGAGVAVGAAVRQLTAGRAGSHAPPLPLHPGAALLQQSLQTGPMNDVGLWDESGEPVGRCVAPAFALANHCCVPSCAHVLSSTGAVQLLALRGLEAGEEVTHCYVNLGLGSGGRGGGSWSGGGSCGGGGGGGGGGSSEGGSEGDGQGGEGGEVVYECENDCGFSGAFAAVEAHERHCDFDFEPPAAGSDMAGEDGDGDGDEGQDDEAYHECERKRAEAIDQSWHFACRCARCVAPASPLVAAFDAAHLCCCGGTVLQRTFSGGGQGAGRGQEGGGSEEACGISCGTGSSEEGNSATVSATTTAAASASVISTTAAAEEECKCNRPQIDASLCT